jgi:hypothetical protein
MASTHFIRIARDPKLLNLFSLFRYPIADISSIRPLILQRLLHILHIKLIFFVLCLEQQVLALSLMVQRKSLGVCGVRFGLAFDSLGLLGLEFGELLCRCSESLLFGFGFRSDDFGKTFAIFSCWQISSVSQPK